MQAKDIPDNVFLLVVATCQLANCEKYNYTGAWATLWDIAGMRPEWPEKVLLAKANKLIRRKLMGGCPCGWCRGDFTLTYLGAKQLDLPLESFNKLILSKSVDE